MHLLEGAINVLKELGRLYLNITDLKSIYLLVGKEGLKNDLNTSTHTSKKLWRLWPGLVTNRLGQFPKTSRKEIVPHVLYKYSVFITFWLPSHYESLDKSVGKYIYIIFLGK